MDKNGQINNLYPVLMALILIGVLIGASMLILSGFQTAAFSSTASSVANESLTTVTEAGETLAKSTLRSVSCDVSACINSTDSVVIPTADWTDSNCIVSYVTNSTADIFNNTNWKCSYSYTYLADTAASNATLSTATSLATIASTWLPVIVVVLAAGIVLGLLLGAFNKKRK